MKLSSKCVRGSLIGQVNDMNPKIRILTNVKLININTAYTRLVHSIKAYIAATHAKTVQQPVHLDASEPWEKWAGLPRNSCDVIIAINLLQYSSFQTAQVDKVIK